MTPPRRRWFAFSLRTMLAAFVAACAFAAWEGNAIRHRTAMLGVFRDRQVVYTIIPAGPSAVKPGASLARRIRWATGDTWIEEVFLRGDCEDIRADVERAFPEAKIVALPPSTGWAF